MKMYSKKLADKRKELKLTIDQVAEKTQIRAHILKSIESGKLDVLPEVYIRSFMKTYGEFLGMSKKEVQIIVDNSFKSEVPKIEADPSMPVKEKPNESSQIDQNKMVFDDTDDIINADDARGKRVKIPVKLILMGALIVVFITVLIVAFWGDADDDNTEKANTDNIEDFQEDTSRIQSFFENDPFQIRVSIVANDTVKIKVKLDTNQLKEMIVYPNKKVDFSADSKIKFLSINTKKVKLSKNGVNLDSINNMKTRFKQITITDQDVDYKIYSKVDTSTSRRTVNTQNQQTVPGSFLVTPPVKPKNPPSGNSGGN